MKPMDENDVVAAVCRHLEKTGYRIEQRLRTTQKGIDIIARHPKKGGFLIEAKGATSSRKGSARYGKPYTRSQLFDRAAKATYTALTLLGSDQLEKRDQVAMAFPDTPAFREYFDRIAPFIRKLGIRVFWVDEKGAVTLD